MKCRLCEKEFNERLVFELKGAPSGAQYYPERQDFANDSGVDLKLCSCPWCNLYQLDNDPVNYFRDVIRSGGYTSTMTDLRKKQYSKMIDHFNLTGKKVFECGCGRGEFLSIWQEFPIASYGIENNSWLVAEATQKGMNVEQGFVGDANSVVKAGKFDAFTSFNFLEHQPNPGGMLQGIYNNLTDDGVGLITVPGWEYIVSNNAYYELVIDHLTYFSRQTFEEILRRNGFVVEFFDDTLADTHAAFVRKHSYSINASLGSSESSLSQKLFDFIRDNPDDEGSTVVWGASHQAFTILTSSGIARYVDYIVDSAEFKQGKYSPVSHLRIKPPDTMSSDTIRKLIIIAPNYSSEILNIVRGRMNILCRVAVVRNGGVDLL